MFGHLVILVLVVIEKKVGHKLLIYTNTSIICFPILIKIMAKQALIAAEAIKCCTFDESGPLR